MAVETNPLEALRNGIGERLKFRFPQLPSVPFLKKTDTATSAVADMESDEITDPLKTLAGLKRKAAVMTEMVDGDHVEELAIGRTRWLVLTWFSNLVKDRGIEGLDNLQLAVTQARGENKRIIFTPTHQADADHGALVKLMSRRRFWIFGRQRGLGIQDELVFLGGAGNIKLRKSISRFTRFVHVIYNVTPRDTRHQHALLANAGTYGLEETQIKDLERIKGTFDQMRIKSEERVKETCVRGRKPMVAYIEGGRSYNGYLKPPIGSFSKLFPRDNSAIVIPCRIYGSREVNPPGKDPKEIWREEIWKFWKRHRISMVVGEPYSSDEIWGVWKTRRDEAKQSNDGKEVEINPMDWPMANIANLDQCFVRPEESSHYVALMEKFAPMRNKMILPDKNGNFHSRVDGQNYPILRHMFPDNWIHILGRKVLGAYMRTWHRLDVQIDPAIPREGPVLFLTNHDSNLTTVALMVADPYYPWTTVPVKREFSRIPVAKQVLDAWHVKYVNRDGEDTKVARELLNVLDEGRTNCIAAEGTRSKDGRLQPMDSSLVSLTLIAARRGYPVVPIAVYGSFKALPPGAFLPKPEKITVKVGRPMDLSPWAVQRSTLEVKTEAARHIQAEMAALLPDDQKPAPGTKPMWDKAEYLKPKKQA